MSQVIRALVIVALLVGVSGAQPSAQARSKAAAHWKQGKAFYDAAQWDHAISEYRAAWELVKEPELLFSIALAHHKKGDLPAALVQYRQYVELAPNGAAADEAREYVAKITAELDQIAAEKTKVEEEAARVRREAEEAERRRQEEAAAESARKKRAAALEAVRRERDARLADTEARARIMRWGGLGVGIAGAVLVGVGIKYGLDAKDASDALTAHTAGPWPDELLARQDAGRSANTRMYVFTGVGSVVLVTGAVVFAQGMRLDARVERERGVAITTGPGDIGLGVTAKF